MEQPLEPQIGLKEKFAQLDHFQAIVSEIEDHSSDLQQLIEKAVELYEKTGDDSFGDAAQEELKTQFNDITTVAKVRQISSFQVSKMFRSLYTKLKKFDFFYFLITKGLTVNNFASGIIKSNENIEYSLLKFNGMQ